MKTKQQIEKALNNVSCTAGPSQFPNSTYEAGVEETLMWILGEINDNEFVYSKIAD